MKNRKTLRMLLFTCILIIALIFATDKWVISSTKSQVYTDLQQIPHNKVGLLLGTAKTLRHGWENLYYKYRIDAAVALYKAGKIDYILVSGDNGTKEYDETSAMQADLIAMGVPKERIFMDYAGFRTLDSILRLKKVFGENAVTIISQPFHNQRAVFIANHKDISAVAYNAKDVSINSGFKTQLREKFARVKMLLDLAFGKNAKFYGEKIEIK
jgi:SanA protein